MCIYKIGVSFIIGCGYIVPIGVSSANFCEIFCTFYNILAKSNFWNENQNWALGFY